MSRTAVLMAFLRAAHHDLHAPRLFDDPIARQLLSPEDWDGLDSFIEEILRRFC
jgi:O-methyltransferase involved in polyketide biosynthesis